MDPISIHAPREGGDYGGIMDLVNYYAISIHAPREGGDFVVICNIKQKGDFNPRPPRGGRRYGSGYRFPSGPISIHAPREGGDYGCKFFAFPW